MMGGTIATAATAKSSFAGFRKVQNEFNQRGEKESSKRSSPNMAREAFFSNRKSRQKM